ncbi:PLP-dependent aminotransferase family protein [Rhodococcus sp. ABRD24]|uniref:aminotransferase-like domain-containing protein n=1 Tax=Rhodococcus sp. ABRD24 TaxID=2507582 RepID=UPI0013F17E67|nr:PLP-dependent aminotransferase family protein [Rhodococcus sp. ABRD24]
MIIWHLLRTEGVPGPRYRSIAECFEALICAGHIRVGEKLPGERDIADALTVSRTTVVQAYRRLKEMGWAESTTGRGTFARRPVKERATRMMDWVETPESDPTAGSAVHSPVVDFVSPTPPAPIELHDAVTSSAAEVVRLADSAVHYLHGLPELRQWIAEWYTARGLPTRSNEVVVTSGAQQALALVCRLFMRPRGSVILESPTYLGALDQMRSRSAHIVSVRSGSAGFDPDHLTEAMRSHRPDLIYTMSTCHSVTGTAMTDEQRQHVVDLAAASSTVIVDDDVYAGLSRSGARQTPLAATNPDAPIITIGGVGKLLWDGLRVGWLRAPAPIAERLARLKGVEDLGTSLIAQIVSLELLHHHTEIAERRKLEAAESLQLTQSLLRAAVPDWTWHNPAEGWSLWIALPHGSATQFAIEARRNGVLIAAGSTFTADGSGDDHLRLVFYKSAADIEAGVRRLGESWMQFGAVSG